MTSHAYTRTLLLMSLFVLTIAHAVHAGDAALGENAFIRLDVGKTHVNLPTEGAVITILLEPYGKTENNFWGESLEVTGGVRLRGLDTKPEDNTRFEAAVNYLSADAKNSVSSSLPLGFFYIDGRGGAGGTGGVGASAVFDTNYHGWGFDLKLVRELAIAGTELMTLFAGMTYFNTELSNDFDLFGPFGPHIYNHLQDETDTDYYGLLVGGDAVVPIWRQLVVDLGGSLALLYADARMEARQRMSSQYLYVDKSENKIAGRAEAHVGLSYDSSPIVFGIGASARYLSYQPYAEHATTIATSRTPSHIVNDDMFSYTFNISMNVAF